MTTITPTPLDFGDSAKTESSLSGLVRRLKGSTILKIAADVRAMIAAGKPVCNLTAGDFDPKQFPIPDALRDGIVTALERGETNYPPSEGILPLRQAVIDYVEREQGIRYPLESVLIAGGGRPLVFAIFEAVVDPGDTVIYSVPSWNNDHYATMSGAKAVEIVATRQNGFQPTFLQIAPHLSKASLLCLCTPGNPTGTVLAQEQLREILEGVVAENHRRRQTGARPVFVLFDQIYSALVFAPAEHHHPLTLVPEAAPYVIALDGISKAFAATGLRVGWGLGPPAVIAKMKDFLGHVGAWAPRPEQVATARFLNDREALDLYMRAMHAGIQARLNALYGGFSDLKSRGYPVDCVEPQGAIYLSLQLNLVGRSFEGVPIRSNEDIRKIMLERAGLGIVPFQAFGLNEDTGWFRMSAGAVSVADIEAAFPRITSFLDRVS